MTKIKIIRVAPGSMQEYMNKLSKLGLPMLHIPSTNEVSGDLVEVTINSVDDLFNIGSALQSQLILGTVLNGDKIIIIYDAYIE